MKAFRIVTALLLIFIFLNYSARKHLPNAFADVADYNLLYTTSSNVYIKKLEVINDSLDILFGGNVKEYNEYTVWPMGPDTTSFIYKRKSLRYKPAAGKSEGIMVWVNNSKASFSLNIQHSSGKYEIASADIAVEPAVVRNVQDWVPHSWEHDERISFASVKQYLRDSIQVNENDSAVQKILKIGQFIMATVPDKDEIPADSISQLHPLQQLQLAQQGKTDLWCGHYTAIFSCLASAAGLSTRTVFTGGTRENLALGNHAFCEVWIEEKKCWAYVDLTHKTILCQLGEQYLNVVDIQRLLRFPSGIDNVMAWTYAGDSLQEVPYNRIASGARYYFHQNTHFIFFYSDYFERLSNPGYWQKFKNLLYTKPYSAVYSDTGAGKNSHLYLRVLSNYLLVIATGIWFIVALLWVRRKILSSKKK